MPHASEQSPFAFLPAGEAEEAHGSPAESEVFHGIGQRYIKPSPLVFGPYKNLPTIILTIHQTKVLTTSLYLVKVKNVVLPLYQFSELK
ncbi:hypothetical protein AS034_18500 [[Bacillus] enclensis]|nr:hypothetical protein AS034_18500 [[Bacillus] enclensis]